MMLEVPNMKINRFLAGMLLGATLMLTGLLLSYLGHDAFFLVAGGGAALATALVRRWQTGDQPERDERTNKIRAFGLAYSWFVSIILALVTFCAVYLGIINLNALTALSAIIYVMTGSAIVFLIFWHHGGDAEWL